MRRNSRLRWITRTGLGSRLSCRQDARAAHTVLPAPEPPVFFRGRLFNSKGCSAHYRAVEGRNSALRLAFSVHFDEAKSLRLAGSLVDDQTDSPHAAIRLEERSDGLLGRGKSEIPDKNIFHASYPD